jgi:hypothetical protein
MDSFAMDARSMFASLLPRRYRSRWLIGRDADLETGALISGMFQTIIFGGAYILALINQLPTLMARAAAIVSQADNGASINVTQVRLSAGVLGLVNFATQPWNMISGYLAAEGILRFIGAMAGDVRGTLPLYLISLTHELLERTGTAIDQWRVISDDVQQSQDESCDLRVLSCRPKPEWNTDITIRYLGEFYVLIGEERSGGARPFVYKLQKHPSGRLVRGIREYRPEDRTTASMW